METVYLETTVVGTIASRNHPDPIMLARQLSTRRWWASAASRFDLKISDLVIAECSAGDPAAANERLEILDGLDVLIPRVDAESLAEALMVGKAVPESEPRDAAHIALAAVHGLMYLVTWNFMHILRTYPKTVPRLRSGLGCAGFSDRFLIRNCSDESTISVATAVSFPRQFARLSNCWSRMTNSNPIEEIKRIRHQLGAEVDFDIHRIFADLRSAQASSNRAYVDLPPCRVAMIHAIQGTVEAKTDIPSKGSSINTAD